MKIYFLAFIFLIILVSAMLGLTYLNNHSGGLIIAGSFFIGWYGSMLWDVLYDKCEIK